MAFGLFKKKDDDDFSDFGEGNTESSHMGLPTDGDITKTSAPQAPSTDDTSMPDAFQKLQQQKAFQESQNSAQQPIQQPAVHNDKIGSLEKDIQVLNAKVDAVRTVLESINNRLNHIEKIAEDSQHKEERVSW